MAREAAQGARERRPADLADQSAAAVRPSDHRRHPPASAVDQGGAGRQRRRRADRRSARWPDPLHREPLRCRRDLLPRRRQPGRLRHRPLARSNRIRRQLDVQPRDPHCADRGRRRRAVGPGRHPADAGGRPLLFRPGRHEPQRLRGGLAGRHAGRVRRRGLGAQFKLAVRRPRPRRRILGEEAFEEAAGARPRRRHRRHHRCGRRRDRAPSRQRARGSRSATARRSAAI